MGLSQSATVEDVKEEDLEDVKKTVKDIKEYVTAMETEDHERARFARETLCKFAHLRPLWARAFELARPPCTGEM